MNAAVEIGAVTTREGAALHPASGCRWSRSLPVIDGTAIELTKANAELCCKTIACRKAIRAQLDAARKVNGERTECSYAVKADKQNVDAYLATLVQLFRTAAEMVRDAELVARYHAPVEPVEVFASSGFSGAMLRAAEPDLLSLIVPAPKTAFVEAVERMGVRANRAPVRPTVKGKRARLAALNMFAPKTKVA